MAETTKGGLGPQRTLLAPTRPPGPLNHRRPTEEARLKQRREALGLGSGSQRSDDEEDEEKENHPKDNESLVEDLLSRLLKTWGAAIDQLHEQISQDLKGFKLKLGIRH
ncbi:E1/E4 protein [Human papillomavirus type 215]|uniref:E1/E4 protein n=1 Tax=Human papillomavirus type 215 TaxID=2060139 RepID=A0A2H4V8F2_9PAPI|nr:E1/E4 protein [Human papillomavirus type 215]